MTTTHELRYWRTIKGHTQAEVAKLTGISLRTIGQIEDGSVRPRMDTRRRLLVLMGRPHSDHRAVFGEMPMQKQPHYSRVVDFNGREQAIRKLAPGLTSEPVKPLGWRPPRGE